MTVTSYGLTDNCRYIGGYQRVDIPVVQKWLAKYGVTPDDGLTPLDVNPNRRTADRRTRTKRTPPFPLPPARLIGSRAPTRT